MTTGKWMYQGAYLPEFSSPGAFPFNFCTSLALLRLMEARSLENDPLRFNFPVWWRRS